MKTFPSDIRFRFPWRKYQQRVLDELETHLNDDRLHVIAPPGSGKTVLGLEVVRRLNRPALILAPTLTIRDQWAERFVQLFLNQNRAPDWISFDLSRPGLLTLATYQALHALQKGREPDAPAQKNGETGKAASRKTSRSPFAALEKAKIGLVVADEAHHLKNAWWKSLMMLLDTLDKPAVAGLTATPPYDVSFAEWKRYQTCFGPVDAEISVPELVIEENLCPHQDYTFFSEPTASEKQKIRSFRKAVSQFADDLLLDFDFLETVESHPWLILPEDHLEAVYEDTEYLSAMLIFLNQAGRWVSEYALETLGAAREDMPPLDHGWLEILLNRVFFGDADRLSDVPPGIQEQMQRHRRRLSRIGGVKRDKVSLTDAARTGKLLSASAGKLESIVEIVRTEAESLGERLRMVILTDYIRAGDMPAYIDNIKPPVRMGVVPIFERVRREYLWEIRPGVLSGSLVVIPESSVSDLQIIAAESDVPLSALSFTPLNHDPGFLKVSVSGGAGGKAVMMMTELFRMGAVNLLIGTRSLLGEGWDAPAVNALILATGVGSWVQSNQMRGRAIRTEPGNPDKTANIWHLICADGDDAEWGEDMKALTRRFKAFAGVSHDGSVIENGIERMGLPDQKPDCGLHEINHSMKGAAGDRDRLRRAWETALRKDESLGRMVGELRLPGPMIPEKLLVRDTARHVLKLAAWLIPPITVFAGTASLELSALWTGIWTAVSATGFWGGFVRFFPRASGHLRRGTNGEALTRMGRIILETLWETGHIRMKQSEIRVEKIGADRWTCHLAGASTFESSLFLDALEEVTAPVDNPRYLILSGKKREAFAVPKILAAGKAKAEAFQKHWRKHFGACELLFTRNPEGRKLLVKARMRNFRGRLTAKTKRGFVWK